jgi:hypothetical protein
LEFNNIEEVRVQKGIDKFRLAMIEKVKSVTLQWSQVGYVGGFNPESLGHLFSLKNVQKLVLRGVTGLARGGLDPVEILTHLKEILIDRCFGAWDVTVLAGIAKVGVIGCTGINDVSSLGGVKDLTLIDNAVQLQGLGLLGGIGQNQLSISGCRNVTEVGHFSAIQTLLLDNTGLTDVSKLGNVKNLTLQRCHSLIDVSALAGVETLRLHQCKNITDVSALYGLHTLDLHACKGIVDVSALGMIHSLDLSYCSNVVDVSALGGVHTLNLSGCHKITDVSNLGSVTRLSLRDCRGIYDVSALKSVKFLDLQGCEVVWEVEMEREEEGGEAKSGGDRRSK